jgi:hypothetical protein
MPTRITDRSATIIDHIYYYEGKYNDDIHVKSGNILADITDHLPNFILLLRKTEKKDLKNQPKIRLFTKSNKDKFCQSLNQINWNEAIFAKMDCNDAYNTFIFEIDRYFNECFPSTSPSIRGCKDKKWVTTGLNKSGKERNKLCKISLTTGRDEDKKKYKEYKKCYEKSAKKAEESYYNAIFDSRCNSAKRIWKQINIICSFKKSKSKNNISKLIINYHEILDPQQI